MNGRKFQEIRQKIQEILGRESESEIVVTLSKIEDDVRTKTQAVEIERQKIERDFQELTPPTNEPLEEIFAPKTPQEKIFGQRSAKILEELKETSLQISAEGALLKNKFEERKISFAKKKAELHQKFLVGKNKDR